MHSRWILTGILISLPILQTAMIMQGSKTNMPQASTEVFDSPPAFTDADAHVLFPVPYIPPTPHGSPPEYSHAPLPAVIALPQMSPGFDQSFARGYHVAMARSGLQMGDWLRFLDALNIAMVSVSSANHSVIC
jgi:hypothetical protein